MRIGARSDVGKVRRVNQDVGFFDEVLGLFIVADGMGGHNGGEIASQTAVDALVGYDWDLVHSLADLERPIALANQAVWQAAQAKPQLRGMGTTVTLAKVVDQRVLIGHVGDSRAYLVSHRGEGKQLTNDHSVVGQLVRDGCLTEGDARRHPHRNVLTKALGTQPNLTVDLSTVEPGPGDVILLCTDGLVDVVSTAEVFAIIHQSPDLQEAADRLVDLANERGGQDNITVVAFGLD
ncbi:MAG: Stp1/IreP family PP2C-type Ser/Thr phosphatase [Firmicutes bacterium]|nr:Stp1/IreP family PP2C-type Ser/Thr phosphatase [Bacillota bacterium]